MTTTDRLKTALADRYKIEREIGSGGMATVYLAEDLKHHRKVAVKVLRPDLAATMGPERFLREIEVAAQLTHPHILPLHDSGEADGFLFYVMPYIEGESLRTKLQRDGELPIAEALRVLRDVVDALASAHRQGVVHRDIKPDNVLLSENHAVVTDFGVAKAVSEATGRQQLTTAGVALGTPAYMAPEQAAAEPHLDHRVDIYAVGAMAYELLTGSPPFTGNTAQQVLSAHVTQEPNPVTAERTSVPPALEQFVMRCLAKKPADRWQTTDEMLPQLEALATPSGGITPTTTRPIQGVAPQRRWQTPVIVAAAAVVITLVGIFTLSGGGAVTPLEFGRQTHVTLDPGLEVDPAISPDGRLMAYARGMPGQMRLFVRPVSGGDPVAISERAPGANHRYPRWSPDGTRILFWADGGLWTVPPLGGAATNVVRENARTPTWSPDGNAIAFMEYRTTNQWALIVQQTEGEQRRELVTGVQIHSPAWSPDGRLIAYVVGNPGYWYGNVMGNLGPTDIHVVPSDGTSPAVAVTAGGHLHGSPTWMPDSRTLLLVSTRSGELDVHRVTLNDDGSAADSVRRVTTGLRANSIQLTADGSQLAYSVLTNTSNVWYVDITGALPVSVRNARQLTFGTEHVEGVAVSPDGDWVAFDSDRGENVDIWRISTAGGEPTQITTDPAADFVPAFSRDGRWITFHSWRTGNRDVFVIAADGSGEEQVTDRPAMDMYPDWGPDGERVVFYSDPTGRYELYISERSGMAWGEPTQLTTGGGRWPDWSPDGTHVAYMGFGGVVASVEVETGRWRALLRPFQRDGVTYAPTHPRWTPDGRIIVKATDPDGFASFWDIAANGGAPRLLVTFDDPSRPFGRPEFATDGRRIYFTIDNRQSDIWVMEVLQES